MLIKSKTENTKVLVHENCRKRFHDKRKLTTINTKDTRDIRKSTSLFNWKQIFFFCAIVIALKTIKILQEETGTSLQRYKYDRVSY